MVRNWVRLAVAAVLLAPIATAQTAPPEDDPATQLRLFLASIRLFPITPAGMTKLEETLGIGERELTAIRKLSAEASAAEAVILEQSKGLTLEARIQRLETGKVAAWLTERQEEIDRAMTALAASRVAALQQLLGETRFQKLAQYIQAAATTNFDALDDRPRTAPRPIVFKK